ncbi:uncharacterized protein ptx4 [Aulostomus maculatus]
MKEASLVSPPHFEKRIQAHSCFYPLLRSTMGGLRPSQWPLIMILMLLIQMQPVQVQRHDPLSQKLRRLGEQFQQFQALTQARLDMMVMNQNRNSTRGLESHVQALNNHYYHMSKDLEHLKQSTTQEIEGFRQLNRKLERKSNRMEGRLALMERNLRENRRQTQKTVLGEEFSNFTLELQSQEERLAALQVQRDELLIGLKGLHDSLKNQEHRVTRLEGRLGEILQMKGWGNTRDLEKVGGPLNSHITPLQDYNPYRRGQTDVAGRPGRVVTEHTQPRPAGIRNSPQLYQHPTMPKDQKPQLAARTQVPYPNSHSKSIIYLPQREPDAHRPQSQIQVQAQTQPLQIQQGRIQSHHQSPQLRSYPQKPHQVHNTNLPSWLQSLSKMQNLPEPNNERQSRTGLGTQQPQASDVLPQVQSQSHQSSLSWLDEGEEEESKSKVDSSVIHNFLQLPLRHKIPAQPPPKKDATICNVDSMLLFPSASVENYVTFSLSLPDLPELSVCLWLRVDTSYVGTLLSYATHDNDNQLVLYGRNPSPSSSYASSSSSPPYPSSSSSHSSSRSLDFVIGDPTFRRLPVKSLLDSHWHHLCILWSSIEGRFWHYNDGRLTSSGSSFRKGWEIPGGGSVVLGQEQDNVGGGFDPSEGFVGWVAGFRIWNRVLTLSEVEGIVEGRGVPRGVVLGMEDVKKVHGEVQQVACECLEHCV